MAGFEWDAGKAFKNLVKHGVDFNDAVKIFARPVVEVIDIRREYGEVRIISIGCAAEDIFTVVSTQRGENRRIISARRSNEKEKRKYHQI
jgi:uncharacterized protein